MKKAPFLRSGSDGKHHITSFETGNMHLRTWVPYQEQILDFLQERDAPSGLYSVRVNRRVRTKLLPGTTRLRPFQRNAIVLLCRPDGADNGEIYECLIIGESRDWNSRDMHFYFKKFDDEHPDANLPDELEPETLPTDVILPSLPAPEIIIPPEPKLTLSEKLARLERIANRARARDELMAELNRQIDSHRQSIGELESRLLVVMQEAESDTECKGAAEDLKALERLLA